MILPGKRNQYSDKYPSLDLNITNINFQMIAKDEKREISFFF